MDTDDLTEMAYETIRIAGGFNDFLRCDIGVRSRDYRDEAEFLEGTRRLLNGISRGAKDYLDYWNLLDEVDVKEFKSNVARVIAHVEKTIAAPEERRGGRPFEGEGGKG